MLSEPQGPGVSIVVVEDDTPLRETLCAAINAQPGMHVAASFDRFSSAMAWLPHQPVDVLLTDLGLPDGSGIDLIKACAASHPQCDIMVITMFGDEKNVLASIEAGAVGYILKDTDQLDVARFIADLRQGGSPMSPLVARKLLTRAQPTAQVPAGRSAGEPRSPARSAGRGGSGARGCGSGARGGRRSVEHQPPGAGRRGGGFDRQVMVAADRTAHLDVIHPQVLVPCVAHRIGGHVIDAHRTLIVLDHSLASHRRRCGRLRRGAMSTVLTGWVLALPARRSARRLVGGARGGGGLARFRRENKAGSVVGLESMPSGRTGR